MWKTKNPESGIRNPESRNLLAACGLLFTSTFLFASESGEFLDANRDFAVGHYADAAQKYERISAMRGVSAPLYFNLANALYRKGAVGKAVLNYERALALSPNDADVEANLQLVRKTNGLFSHEPAYAERVAHAMGMDAWAWLTSGSLFLFCGAAGMFLFSKGRAWRPVAVISLFLLVAGGTSLMILAKDFKRAVVLLPDTPVRIGPFDTATISTTLSSGEIVRVQGEHEQFFLIHSHADKTGWVSKEQVEKILKE